MASAALKVAGRFMVSLTLMSVAQYLTLALALLFNVKTNVNRSFVNVTMYVCG